MKTTVSTLAALAGGAGLGALAMFLLDPELGEDRRGRLQENAQSLLETTGGRLGVSKDAVMKQARQAPGQLRGLAGKWLSQASSYTDSAGDYAASAGKSARKYARDNIPHAKDYLDDDSSGYGTALTLGLTALGFGVLGAGLMYLMDPEKGEHRRSQISDKVSSYWPQRGGQAGSSNDSGNNDHNTVQDAAYPRGESDMSEHRTPSSEQL